MLSNSLRHTTKSNELLGPGGQPAVCAERKAFVSAFPTGIRWQASGAGVRCARFTDNHPNSSGKICNAWPAAPAEGEKHAAHISARIGSDVSVRFGWNRSAFAGSTPEA